MNYDGYEGGLLMAQHGQEGETHRDLHGFCSKMQTMVEVRVSAFAQATKARTTALSTNALPLLRGPACLAPP